MQSARDKAEKNKKQHASRTIRRIERIAGLLTQGVSEEFYESSLSSNSTGLESLVLNPHSTQNGRAGGFERYCLVASSEKFESTRRQLVPWHSETGKVIDGTHSTLKHHANIFGKNDIWASVPLALNFGPIPHCDLAALGVGLVLVAGD